MENYTNRQLVTNNLQSINESLEKMYIGYLLSQYADTDSKLEIAIVSENFLCLQKIIKNLEN